MVEMRKLAVSITKGGTAKSTTVCALSQGLALANKKVLVVDLDTQGQLRDFYGVSPQAGVAEVILDEVKPEEGLCQVRENIWLLAGGKNLGGVKNEIAKKDFGSELTLKKALTAFEGEFDYVLLDTSPSWDALFVNALFYAHEIVSPVSLEALSLKCLVNFESNLKQVQEYNPNIALKYIVPTFLDKRVKKSEELLALLTKHYGDRVCTPIRYNVKLSEAPAFGKTIFEFDKFSKGARDYSSLTQRILEDG